MVYSGMGPDFRLLVRKARKLAQQYYLQYQESIPVSQLVQKVATVMQEYTQSGWVGVGGVCMCVCVCGWVWVYVWGLVQSKSAYCVKGIN